MDHMTKVEGVPSADQAIPGMAFFAGTGPAGKTCGDCKHRGYYRESMTGRWDEGLQQTVNRTSRVTKCAVFKTMTGRHGTDIAPDCRSCKYFEHR